MRFLVLFMMMAVMAVALDPQLLTQLKNKKNAVTTAKKSKAVVRPESIRTEEVYSNYVVINTYDTSAVCSGVPNLSMGLAYDACLAGDVDYTNGTPLNSVKYYKDEAGTLYMAYYSESGVCDGTPTSTEVTVPTPCINSEMQVTKSNVTEPWALNNADGVAVEFFFSAEDCAAGGSGYDFLWYSSSFCVPDAAEDASYLSYKYMGCSDGQVVVNYFTDSACATLLRTESTAPSNCFETTNNMQAAWMTQACSSHASV